MKILKEHIKTVQLKAMSADPGQLAALQEFCSLRAKQTTVLPREKSLQATGMLAVLQDMSKRV